MRRFCIDSSYLGTPRHIIGDPEGYQWSDSVPRDSWHFTGETKNSRCLDTLFKLVGHQPAEVAPRYITAMNNLVTGSISVPIPWMHAVPQDEFRIFFKNLIQGTMDVFSELPFEYCEGPWTAGGRVLSALKPAKIDPVSLQEEIDSQGSNSNVLEGFRPKRSGFAHLPVYDRFSTRTGRLTITEGPNILVLKKGARRIIQSSFEGGAICYLDFRALEARIVLAEAGRYSSAEDMYAEMAEGLFGGRLSRDAVKTAVIAELYGISRASLRLRLGVDDRTLDSFIGTIRSHFGLEELQKRLEKEYEETGGKINNRFGRPLQIPPGHKNLLINTYAQSTGVDVSMLGFDSVIRSLGPEGIRPLFVLHDAIILDVRNDRLHEVSSMKHVPIPTYEQPFLLKYEIL